LSNYTTLFVAPKGTEFDELTSDSVKTLGDILNSTRSVSICDVACLVLAEQMNAPLVTHDKRLLAVVRTRNVHTHDFDALLDLMVTAGIIESEARQTAFETLVRISERPR